MSSPSQAPSNEAEQRKSPKKAELEPGKIAESGTGARPYLLPLVLVLALTGPLLCAFGLAVADGYAQRREAPLRAVLGNAAYRDLEAGLTTARHYWGNSLVAPDFTLSDRDDVPFRLSDHRGKTIVLNFWSVTCKPCIEEMPSLVTLAEIAKEWGDTEVVTVTMDQSWADVKTVFKGFAPPFPVLFDPEKQVIEKAFGTKFFPETWIIDKEGTVRLRIDGARDWSTPLMLDLVSLFR